MSVENFLDTCGISLFTCSMKPTPTNAKMRSVNQSFNTALEYKTGCISYQVEALQETIERHDGSRKLNATPSRRTLNIHVGAYFDIRFGKSIQPTWTF